MDEKLTFDRRQFVVVSSNQSTVLYISGKVRFLWFIEWWFFFGWVRVRAGVTTFSLGAGQWHLVSFEHKDTLNVSVLSEPLPHQDIAVVEEVELPAIYFY